MLVLSLLGEGDDVIGPELPPCPKVGYFCRCLRCVEDGRFFGALIRDIENGAPLGKGESGA